MIDPIPEADWSAAFQQYEYTPNNPYIQQPEFIPHAIDTTPSDTVMALEAESQLRPGDANTWHQLGIRQQENERDKAAIAALERAVSIDPSHLDAWLALSISYTNEHRRNDAYRCLEQWIAHHPHYNHLPYCNDDERHRAITRLFLAAARESPGQVDADVQIGLGVLLNMSHEYEKAMDCFKTALATRPDDYQLWNKVGATLQKTGDSQGALEMYVNALEMNPLYVRARYNLAVSYMHLGKYREAASEFLTTLELQKTAEVGSNDTNESIWNSLRLLMFM
jgi:peroxin-5